MLSNEECKQAIKKWGKSRGNFEEVKKLIDPSNRIITSIFIVPGLFIANLVMNYFPGELLLKSLIAINNSFHIFIFFKCFK